MVCVSDKGSITFYRPPCKLESMISKKIFTDCRFTPFFLRFPAGIADSRFHDKTNNTDSRCCCVPGDWVLFGEVVADDGTTSLSGCVTTIERATEFPQPPFCLHASGELADLFAPLPAIIVNVYDIFREFSPSRTNRGKS